MKTAQLQATGFVLLALTLFALTPTCAASAKPTKTAWGQITPVAGDVGKYRLTLTSPPENGKLALPTPFANVTRAYYNVAPQNYAANRKLFRFPLLVEFNKDATQINIDLLGSGCKTLTGDILLETAEKSRQFADGRIVFSALDAKVIGNRAKLETHPGNHRIGFWTNPNDTVSWKYQATRPGTYLVELTYSGAGNDGTEIEVAIGDAKVSGKLKSTGSYYRYTTLPLGNVQLPTADHSYAITVRCTKKTGGAVMNLKAITLRPTTEGQPPTQAADGSIALEAHDVTIRGVKVRWEPLPKKRCIGYWTNASDQVTWEFQVDRPGKFEVELVQGCGTGQGGSEVQLSVDQQRLDFVVKDTGHFQNFVERNIGQITIDKRGWHQLAIRPQKKAHAAVMDVRRVRLLPVAEK